MSLLITWKSERYEVNMIQEFGHDWINIKLADLVQYLSTKTLQEAAGIKLLCSGGTDWKGSFVLMKDLDAPLSFYNIRNRSKLYMICDTSQIHQKLSQIKNNITNDIIPLINNLKQTELPQRESSKLHLKTSELLMQTLFQVDALECESDSEKQARKELVKWIQAHLDAVDEIKRNMEN